MTDAAAHPDDEQLSAALDGEAGEGGADRPRTGQHLRDCAACRARLAELDDVRQAVGGTIAPAPPGLADRAVPAALAAWSEERAARGTGTAAGQPGPAGASSPFPPTGRTGPGAEPAAADGLAPVVPLRRRVLGWALGAAAAVLALLVAVPVLTRNGDDAGNDQLAAARPSDEATAEKALVDGGDLGAQTDPRALNQALQAAVLRPVALTQDALAAGAEESGRAAGEPGATAAAPAPAPAAGLATTAPTTLRSATNLSSPAEPSPCAATVRSEYGEGLGALLYQANLEWRGRPAVVLAYELAGPAGEGPGRRAFVMARDGCELLVAQGF